MPKARMLTAKMIMARTAMAEGEPLALSDADIKAAGIKVVELKAEPIPTSSAWRRRCRRTRAAWPMWRQKYPAVSCG